MLYAKSQSQNAEIILRRIPDLYRFESVLEKDLPNYATLNQAPKSPKKGKK